MWDLLTEICDSMVSLLLVLTSHLSHQTVHACLQGDQIGIAPQMFKALVGRGHPEFSTNRQQDAQEFLLHFINMVEVKHLPLFASHLGTQLSPHIISFHTQRNCRSGSNPSEAFRFLVEERIVCQQSQKAKYTQRVDYIVQLPVPMDQATNTGETILLLVSSMVA